MVHAAYRLSDSCGGDYGLYSSSDGNGDAVTVHLSLGAIARDVASLAATIAGLASGVERAAVRGSAVTRDVTWDVALHGLSLAVASEMVWSAALVASGRAGASSESAPEAAEAATRSTGSASHSWVRAVAGKMTVEATAVAASAGASSAQAQSRAVGLYVSEALAVVALLGCPLVSLLFLSGVRDSPSKHRS
ncbi:hypothetical protein P153DRAFT_44724 [Dothidotthia symphoricarpi CBS 119687]|uniref:Uncharacterized protein n=1 Tax=Dothidotthia symphoricarpi CBS 119687 TaxID=1392245 RepID=A0A6A6A7J7_9PLEO|nr:uncharacterized protein P153DRAFT_44724 [Dothidotthia symphoricarpi CBS 119687]KAF2127952.1 hypothetical protein P153DRAFT_44724 [Dothidotthia symphoricarpi CBS 119687]